MVKSFFQRTCVCVLPVLFACSSTNNKPLLIDFSADSSAIVISDIGETGLLLLKDKEVTDSTLQTLAAVLQTPSEKYPELKESPVEGRFVVTDSSLMFIPVKPFVIGQEYLVVTHLNAKFAHVSDLLKGPLANRIKPQQKTLTR